MAWSTRGREGVKIIIILQLDSILALLSIFYLSNKAGGGVGLGGGWDHTHSTAFNFHLYSFEHSFIQSCWQFETKCYNVEICFYTKVTLGMLHFPYNLSCSDAV